MIPIPHIPRQLPAIGVQKARFNVIADIGTQQTEYKGVKEERRKLIWIWELPLIIGRLGVDKGKPLTVMQTFNISDGENSNMRKFIQAIRGKFKDKEEMAAWFRTSIWKMPGYPCQVTIEHANEFANVTACMLLAKEDVATAPKGVRTPLFFTLDAKYWDPKPSDHFEPEEAEMLKRFGTMKAVYEKLPEYVRKKVSESKEYPLVSTGRGFEVEQADVDPGHDVDAPPPEDDDVPF